MGLQSESSQSTKNDKKRKSIDTKNTPENKKVKQTPEKPSRNSLPNSQLNQSQSQSNKPSRLPASGSLLQLFWNLSDSSDSARKVATKTLITSLFSPKKDLNSSSNDIASVQADVNYTLQRLIKGLATSDLSARKGFFLALVSLFLFHKKQVVESQNKTKNVQNQENKNKEKESLEVDKQRELVLKTFPDLFDLIELIQNKLTPLASMSPKEQRNVYLGRLFSYSALIESKQTSLSIPTLPLSNKEIDVSSISSPISSATLSQKEKEGLSQMISDIISISKKKNIFVYLAYSILCDLLSQMTVQCFENTAKSHILELFASWVPSGESQKGDTELSPEQLGMILLVENRFQTRVSGTNSFYFFPQKLVTKERTSELATILLKTKSLVGQHRPLFDTPKSQSSSAYELPVRPISVHFVWTYLFHYLFKSSQKSQNNDQISVLFLELWNRCFPFCDSNRKLVNLKNESETNENNTNNKPKPKGTLNNSIVELMFQVFNHLVLHPLFTPSLLSSLLNRSFLNFVLSEPAYKSLLINSLQNLCTKSQRRREFSLKLIRILISGCQMASFDNLSKSKLIENIVKILDFDQLVEYYNYLRFLWNSDSLQINTTNNNSYKGKKNNNSNNFITYEIEEQKKEVEKKWKIWVLNQIYSLSKNSNVKNTLKNKESNDTSNKKLDRKEVRDFIDSLLIFFALNGFYQKKISEISSIKNDDSIPTFSSKLSPLSLSDISSRILQEPVRRTAQDRLLSLLADLSQTSSHPNKNSQDNKFDKIEWIERLVYYIWNELNGIENSKNQNNNKFSKEIFLISELNEDTKEIHQKVNSWIHELNNIIEGKSKDLGKEEAFAFKLLFLNGVLQSYIDQMDSTTVLNDLHQCLTSVKEMNQKYSKPQKGKNQEKDEERENWDVFLIDILISLLSHNSRFIRSIVESTFNTFCLKLSKKSLTLLVSVATQHTENEGEEEEEEEGDDDSDDDDSDDDSDDDDSGDDDSGEEDDSVDEGEDIKMDVEDKTKSDKKKTSSKKIPNGDVNEDESEDENENENEDENEDEAENDDKNDKVLGDDDMMEYDQQLSLMFKSMRQARLEKKQKEKETLHFQFRVIDLIETYLKKKSNQAQKKEEKEKKKKNQKQETEGKDFYLSLCSVLPTLLSALCSSKSSPPYVSRLSSLLNSIPKIRVFNIHFSSDNYDELSKLITEDIDKVFNEIHNASTSSLSLTCGRVLLWMLRVLQFNSQTHSTEKEAELNKLLKLTVLKRYSKIIEEFCNKKKNFHVDKNFFEEIYKRRPSLGFEIFSGFFECHKKIKSTFILKSVFSSWNFLFSQRFENDQAKYYSSISSHFFKICTFYLKSFAQSKDPTTKPSDEEKPNDEEKLNNDKNQKKKNQKKKIDKQLILTQKDIIDILLAMKNYLSRLNSLSVEMESEWKSGEFISLIEQVRQHSTGQHPKSLSKDILQLLLVKPEQQQQQQQQKQQKQQKQHQ